MHLQEYLAGKIGARSGRKLAWEMCAEDLTEVHSASSLQRAFNAAWPEYRGGWLQNLKPAGIWIPNHCETSAAASCELQNRNILIANHRAPCS